MFTSNPWLGLSSGKFKHIAPLGLRALPMPFWAYIPLVQASACTAVSGLFLRKQGLNRRSIRLSQALALHVLEQSSKPIMLFQHPHKLRLVMRPRYVRHTLRPWDTAAPRAFCFHQYCPGLHKQCARDVMPPGTPGPPWSNITVSWPGFGYAVVNSCVCLFPISISILRTFDWTCSGLLSRDRYFIFLLLKRQEV